MSSRLIDDMDSAWTSSDAALLEATVDTRAPFTESLASNRIEAQLGSAGTSVSLSPGTPVDLREFTELRLWIFADSVATGARSAPFYFDFGFEDAADLPGEEHRWLVSVNRPNTWLRRRFGIEQERRSAITQFNIRSLSDAPFVVYVDHLLAVEAELLADVEDALTGLLAIAIPALTAIPFAVPATSGDTEITLQSTPGLAAGNRVLLTGGTAGDETLNIAAVAETLGGTTITFAAGETLAGDFPLGSALTLLVPVVLDLPDDLAELPSPAVAIANTDLREDLERAAYFTQQDSFRTAGTLVVCSARPAPRPYVLDYQCSVIAPDRALHRMIHSRLVALLSGTQGLRVNGDLLPLEMLPPPELSAERDIRQVAPVYVRVGSTLEVAPRETRTLANGVAIAAALLAAPTDFETVTIDL